MNMEIAVSKELKEVAPNFVGAAVVADVVNTDYSEELWAEINKFCDDLRGRYSICDIKNRSAISATRTVYKKCKKDPNRYRPAAEALTRRVIKGESLYQINTLVDLVNFVSLKTGVSMGGFDMSFIKGDNLVLGIGRANELFKGIGRGKLNIEGLPVYRDAEGGIGTPTSDEERTRLRENTTHFIALINGYNGVDGAKDAVDVLIKLLEEYAGVNEDEVCVQFYK